MNANLLIIQLLCQYIIEFENNNLLIGQETVVM